jgi:hypothetical protein
MPSKHRLFIIAEILILLFITLSPIVIVFISTINNTIVLTSKASLLLKTGFLCWLLILLPAVYGLIIELIYPANKK